MGESGFKLNDFRIEVDRIEMIQNFMKWNMKHERIAGKMVGPLVGDTLGYLSGGVCSSISQLLSISERFMSVRWRKHIPTTIFIHNKFDYVANSYIASK